MGLIKREIIIATGMVWPVSFNECPKFTATVKESGIEYLESGIYSVESRIQDYLKQHSHLVPEHGPQVRYSLGTSVNTPFF